MTDMPREIYAVLNKRDERMNIWFNSKGLGTKYHHDDVVKELNARIAELESECVKHVDINKLLAAKNLHVEEFRTETRRWTAIAPLLAQRLYCLGSPIGKAYLYINELFWKVFKRWVMK